MGALRFRGSLGQTTRIPRPQPCQLCGCGEAEIVGRYDRRGSDLTTALCPRCGLVSHWEIPGDDELAVYYADCYRSHYHGQATPEPHRVVRAWKHARRISGRMLAHLPRASDVLEVGAGLGCTVKALELAGHRAVGIEPGGSFHRFSQRVLGAKVERGMLETVTGDQHYDLVLLIHVIEHFNHPLRSLRRIRRLLRPNGLLYLECPNIAGPHAAPGKQFHFAHIYNFSPPTLLMMARVAGFRLVKSYAGPQSAELEMLFVAAEPMPLEVDTGSYRQVRRALDRYSTLSYHLRSRYVGQRVLRAASLLHDHLAARWRVERIGRRCRSKAPEPQIARRGELLASQPTG